MLVFPETAVIMVARQRFQMFESAQFHSKDHLPDSMCNLLKQIEITLLDWGITEC